MHLVAPLVCGALVLASATASIAAGSARGDGSSGVIIRVLLGPTCPVERDPPDPACAPRPHDTQITILRRERVVRTVRSGADGRVKAALRPGRYALQPVQGESVGFPSCEQVDVRVPRGEYVRARIDCDSGIR